MKYRYDKKVKKRLFRTRKARTILLTALSLLLLSTGVYILLLLLAPELHMPAQPKKWNAPVPKKELTEDRLYIPRIKLNVTYKAGDARVLRDNIWHRFPERGDPAKGGNFILAGHRFEIGLTPGETKRRSPLYHMDAVMQGDKIYADFEGKRYVYEVTQRFKVKPSQVEIEEPSEEAKMTLYTCTFQGAADGREVIVARLLESDIDPNKPLE